MYFQCNLDQKILAHLAYWTSGLRQGSHFHCADQQDLFAPATQARLARRNSSGNSWKKEPLLNFLGCLAHKQSFNAYHVFSRSNDREKTRNNMVVTRITARRASWKLASASDSIFLRVSLYEFISGANSSFYQKKPDPIYLCNKLTK